MIKPVKDEFQTDWAAQADASIPQAEVSDVSSVLFIIMLF